MLGSNPDDETTPIQHNHGPERLRREVGDRKMMLSRVAQRVGPGYVFDTHALGARVTNHIASQFVESWVCPKWTRVTEQRHSGGDLGYHAMNFGCVIFDRKMVDSSRLDDSDVPARQVVEDPLPSRMNYTLDQIGSFLSGPGADMQFASKV